MLSLTLAKRNQLIIQFERMMLLKLIKEKRKRIEKNIKKSK